MSTTLILDELVKSHDLLQNVLSQLSCTHTHMYIFDDQQNGYVSKKMSFDQHDFDKMKHTLQHITQLVELSKSVIERIEKL